MTTRSFSFGTGETPLEEYSYATGNDGKYETFQGVPRLKWNDYYLQTMKVRRSPGISPWYTGNTWLAGNRFPPRQLGANDILTVQSRLAEAVKGHQFNLAVTAAEGKKTVEMVVNAAHSVVGAISDLRKGKFESAARRFGVAQRPSALSKKDVAGRWLELQYGWLPLISDVYESAKAYEAITSPPRRSRISTSVSVNSIGDFSNSPTLYSVKGAMKEQVRIIYEMTEEISTSRSLGLADPATVAWELIPYSFVVDWFLPVGDYLENLNIIPQLQGRFLTISTVRAQGTYGDKGVIPWDVQPQINSSCFFLERIVSTSLSVPKPQFNKLPDAMSPSRIYNAIALGVQRLR